jgi:hypothetical protein
MPIVVDYPVVLSALESKGFKCLYHNSGAFGFADASAVRHLGWIGKADPTIKETAKPFTRQMPEPFVATLVDGLIETWQSKLPGTVWAMPKSHWSYELEFGNTTLLTEVLAIADINPADLKPRNNGAAIAFEPNESDALKRFVTRLLEDLDGSDFLLAFPNHAAVCTIHHHQQIWWQSTNHELIQSLK